MPEIPYTQPSGYTPQTPLSEQWHAGGFLVSQSNGHLYIDDVLITGAAKILPGTVLGKQTVGSTSTAAATSGNTGNGTITVDGTTPVLAGGQAGAYSVVMDSATEFTVYDPNGKEVGVGKSGTAFATQIKFAFAAGGTAMVAGDSFTVTVAAGTGKFLTSKTTATDGSQVPAGICYGLSDATLTDVKGSVVTRQCEVNASELIWDSSYSTTPQLTAGAAALTALGIIQR